MSFRVEVVCENAIGGEQRRTVIALEQRELAMETLGMTLSDGKALLAGVQERPSARSCSALQAIPISAAIEARSR